MQKLLITGISGFLGTHLYNGLKKNYEIYGTYQNNQPSIKQNVFKINIADAYAINKLLLQIKPNIIIHTAAISSMAQCEAQQDYSYKVNVTASETLAKYANTHNAKFYFCSTDLVFDGTNGNYKEEDLPNPINIYGKQKAAAEKYCILANKNSFIIRLPLIIGENNKGFAGVVAEMQYKNKNNETIYLFINEYRSAALVEDIVAGFSILLQQNNGDIYHLAGTQKLNRLQIAQYIKEKYKLENIKLIGTTHQNKNITNRPANVSLHTHKMQALGFVAKKLFPFD